MYSVVNDYVSRWLGVAALTWMAWVVAVMYFWPDVVWQTEADRQFLTEAGWRSLAAGGFVAVATGTAHVIFFARARRRQKRNQHTSGA